MCENEGLWEFLTLILDYMCAGLNVYLFYKIVENRTLLLLRITTIISRSRSINL